MHFLFAEGLEADVLAFTCIAGDERWHGGRWSWTTGNRSSITCYVSCFRRLRTIIPYICTSMDFHYAMLW